MHHQPARASALGGELRTRQVGVFPNADADVRLLTGIYIEIDEEWETSQLPYIHWGRQEEPKCAA